MATGLADFRSFVSSFIGLIAAGTATTALVLVTAFLGVEPPWPPNIIQITAVVQLIALIFAYQFCLNLSRQKINRTMLTALLVLVVGSVLYFSISSLVVYDITTIGSKAIKGYFCTADAILVYKDSCPFLTQDQIDDAAYTPDLLWSPVGLLLSRMSLLVAWLWMFASLVLMVGAFVAYQRKQTVRRAQP